jgi:hypothetical protein
LVHPGGSGGGSSVYSSTVFAGSGNTPPVSPPQGNNGGAGANTGAGFNRSGGGGGSSSAGGAGAGSIMEEVEEQELQIVIIRMSPVTYAVEVEVDQLHNQVEQQEQVVQEGVEQEHQHWNSRNFQEQLILEEVEEVVDIQIRLQVVMEVQVLS